MAKQQNIPVRGDMLTLTITQDDIKQSTEFAYGNAVIMRSLVRTFPTLGSVAWYGPKGRDGIVLSIDYGESYSYDFDEDTKDAISFYDKEGEWPVSVTTIMLAPELFKDAQQSQGIGAGRFESVAGDPVETSRRLYFDENLTKN